MAELMLFKVGEFCNLLRVFCLSVYKTISIHVGTFYCYTINRQVQDHVLSGVQSIVGYQHNFKRLLDFMHAGQAEKVVLRHPAPSGTKLLEAWNELKADSLEVGPTVPPDMQHMKQMHM